MMNNNILFLAISFIYICLLVLIGFILYRYTKIGSESVRKFIHILTSNWIFLVYYGMDDPVCMLLGPFCFIIINAVFVYGGFGKYLGMGDRKRDNGLIYYPISILVLVGASLLGWINRCNVIVGILIMGWGDGMAALVGTLFGRHGYKVFSRYKKSVEGTLTMFVVSLLVILLFSSVPWYWAVVVAVLASILENFTPLGIDNLTVPIISAFALEAICHL